MQCSTVRLNAPVLPGALRLSDLDKDGEMEIAVGTAGACQARVYLCSVSRECAACVNLCVCVCARAVIMCVLFCM